MTGGTAGEICCGLGASHSPILFIEPHKWLERVHQGMAPDAGPPSFHLTPENIDASRRQVARCIDAYQRLRDELASLRPDALVIIGDDQGENFSHRLIPQFAVYAGEEAAGSFSLGRRVPAEIQDDTRTVTVPCDRDLAEGVIEACLEDGIDLAYSRELPSADGLGHAHIWPLRHLTPALDLPIVPVFVNAYFPPLPPAARCHALGRAIAKAVERSGKRVAVFASGGMSHFPRHLASWGIAPYSEEQRWTIAESFDRDLLDRLVQGEGASLAALDSDALQGSGNNESRNWIVLAGALGDRKGELLAYEPVYTVAIGLAAALWR